jgi:hypothetical protein
MNAAFQTLLSSVSDMGLNEGDFLRMNNLLKKAYDENKKEVDISQTSSKPIDIRILLKDTMDKRVFELNLSSITRQLSPAYPNQPYDFLPLRSIDGHFKSDTHTSVITFNNVREFGKFLGGWVKRVRPMTITIVTEGFETNHTFKSVLANCKAEDAEEEDLDEDGGFDYAYSMVMGQRFVDMFQDFLFHAL